MPPELTILAEDTPVLRLVAIDPHRPLSAVLAERGLPLNTRCGGRGLCRGCEVELRAGSLRVEGQPVAAPATLRACRAHDAGEAATLEVPPRSRMDHRAQVEDSFEVLTPWRLQPRFPAEGGRDTGFAVDIGTTTVAVLLVDLHTGAALGRAGAFNAQIRHGDNVLTRIDAARDPAVLENLRQAIVAETLVPLLRTACERAQRETARLRAGTIAGNTTMLHLLVGADPTPLGVAPFTARFLDTRAETAGSLGLALEGLDAATPICLLPGLAAYVGADISAGIHTCGQDYDERPSLLVDIGTNGEIALHRDGALLATATAAGPAFEGSGLRCGTRARAGAVSQIHVTGGVPALDLAVIGDVPLARASGICGSGYVDFLATARASGLLNEVGRFEAQAWERLPEPHRGEDEGRKALLLRGRDDTAALRITEVDIALLLQAKAAIGAGIETLLTQAELTPGDIGTLYLAGGFGMHINLDHAIAIGLLPGFRREQVRVVGNTALGGAMLALLDAEALPAMQALRGRATIVELNLDPDFEDRYIEHLRLE